MCCLSSSKPGRLGSLPEAPLGCLGFAHVSGKLLCFSRRFGGDVRLFAFLTVGRLLCLKVAGFLGRSMPATVQGRSGERGEKAVSDGWPCPRTPVCFFFFFVSTAVIRLSFAGGRFAGKHVARKKDTNRLHTLEVGGRLCGVSCRSLFSSPRSAYHGRHGVNGRCGILLTCNMKMPSSLCCEGGVAPPWRVRACTAVLYGLDFIEWYTYER